jgi:hypothetical protein
MRIFRLIFEILREIGDENAYRRFLTSNQRAPSREAWREFSEKRFGRKYRNAKCC